MEHTPDTLRGLIMPAAVELADLLAAPLDAEHDAYRPMSPGVVGTIIDLGVSEGAEPAWQLGIEHDAGYGHFEVRLTSDCGCDAEATFDDETPAVAGQIQDWAFTVALRHMMR